MIGYYAHHHGSGHLSRATALAAHLDEPVTVLSSAKPDPGAPFRDWVELENDADHTGRGGDPTAALALHWAPLHHGGLQSRMARIASWIARTRPRVMVVDVSVEVTSLARLCGVPVVVLAMPGERADDAHQWGYRLASRIIAPWPRELYAPSWLRPFDDRVDYVGSFSRFDDRTPCEPPRRPVQRALLLAGTGGSSMPDDLVSRLEARRPQIDWDVLGGSAPWRDDVWAALCAADLVVSHAGQNAVAEVAAARRPAILVPEARPHLEQQRTVEALHRGGIVRAGSSWAEVAGALCVETVDPGQWVRWAPSGAVQHAAAVISEVAAQADAP